MNSLRLLFSDDYPPWEDLQDQLNSFLVLFYKQMQSQTLTLAERGVLDPADGINAVIVIPVQEAQLYLKDANKRFSFSK